MSLKREKTMNEGYVKVSWENNAKTGAAENVVIDTEASAPEVSFIGYPALDAMDEEIKAQAEAQGAATQQ